MPSDPLPPPRGLFGGGSIAGDRDEAEESFRDAEAEMFEASAAASVQEGPSCFANNKLSKSLSRLVFGDDRASRFIEVVEVSSLVSVGADAIAIVRKGGGSLGTNKPYASGFNMVGRAMARAFNKRTLIPKVVAIGDRLTPAALAVSVSSLSFNATIAIQCKRGIIE